MFYLHADSTLKTIYSNTLHKTDLDFGNGNMSKRMSIVNILHEIQFLAAKVTQLKPHLLQGLVVVKVYQT